MILGISAKTIYEKPIQKAPTPSVRAAVMADELAAHKDSPSTTNSLKAYNAGPYHESIMKSGRLTGPARE